MERELLGAAGEIFGLVYEKLSILWDVGMIICTDALLLSDGLSGERRDKPACCRGCKSPTGKEIANPS